VTQPGKVDRQPAYVLHTQPWRETSLLLDVLSRDYGRLTLVARSARRPQSVLRGVLLPFAPLEIAWFGKGEVKTLHAADWLGGVKQLAGLPLLSGFYLNELTLKLTAREDPIPEVFAAYDKAVHGLADEAALASVLRRYELELLGALGYAPQLSTDQHGQPVQPEALYCCRANAAPQRDDGSLPGPQEILISGATLLALNEGSFETPDIRRESRAILRLFLNEILGGETLATRDLLQSISALSD
jgi:DNA repair protein RecO (recombination protein O)